MEEGEKIADGAINVCLRGPRKNLIIPGVFSCRSCKSQGEEDRLFGRVHSEFHFRVPHEDDGPPVRCRRQRGTKKKKGSSYVHVTCVVRRDFRGVTRSIYSTHGSEGGCNEDNCKFASLNSRLRFANREIRDDYRKFVHLQLLCTACF